MNVMKTLYFLERELKAFNMVPIINPFFNGTFPLIKEFRDVLGAEFGKTSL